MGSGKWSASDWTTVSKSYASKDSVYDKTLNKANDSLDVKNVSLRESRDSADSPNSTPIIVALDVTGSMSSVLESMARVGLNTLVTEIYEKKPVTDPHIMCMGVGDASCDRYPLQATQFEADIRIIKQLETLYLEGGGGGNDHESYTLPWYFASQFIKFDSFVKRNQKGFIFTIGDECCPKSLTSAQIEKTFGKPGETCNSSDLLDSVSQSWHVYHLVVMQGSYFRTSPDKATASWKNILGQNAIFLEDYTKMGEVISSILRLHGDEDAASITASWDGSTALTVKKAISDLVVKPQTSGLVTL